MTRALALLTAVLSALAGPLLAGDDLSFGKAWLAPDIGTLGIGIEGGYRWNEYWGARFGIDGLSARFKHHDKDADLVNRLSLLSAGATADYYPFAGDFRVSAGLRLSANRIDGELRNLKKRRKHYSVTILDPLTDYTVRQNALQPYLGAGYSVSVRDRVSLDFDFGALYAGAPKLGVRSRAERFGFSRQDIETEIEKQRRRLLPYQVYPVMQIGLTVRF